MSIAPLSNKIPLLSTNPLDDSNGLGYDVLGLGDSLATIMPVGKENRDTSLPDLSDFLTMPLLPLYDIPNLDDSLATTMAVGEEDGGLSGALPDLSDFLTMPVFQPKEMPKLEDFSITTQAVGEEDNVNLDNSFPDFLTFLGESVFPDMPDEMGVNDDMLTTQAVGEEDMMTEGHSSIAVGEFNPAIPSKKTDITSALMGEEDVFGSVSDDYFIDGVK